MPAYGGTQRLSRLVGPAQARELIFTGSLVPAAEALRIGLANRVVPSGQELRAARDLAHAIAQRAPKAVAAAKRAIAQGLDLPLEEALALEAKEFLERRAPERRPERGDHRLRGASTAEVPGNVACRSSSRSPRTRRRSARASGPS